jgi:hypothetical protein
MLQQLIWVICFGLLFSAAGLLARHLALCWRADDHCSSPQVSLLFVVRDQAALVEGLIRNVLSFYRSYFYHYEVVVLDFFSIDETPAILDKLNQLNSFILIKADQCAEIPPLAESLRACRGDVICYFDLTGSFCLGRITELIGLFLREERRYRRLCNQEG